MKPQFIWHFLVGTLCILPVGGGAAATGERIVAVSGAGEVSAEPDRALVMLGVEARTSDLQTAREQVDETVERFLKLCAELRIPDPHVRTTGATVRPEYDWNNQTRERKLSGYYASRALEVDLRDLDKLGSLMDRAVKLGVNQVSAPVLGSTKADELRREALAKAAEDARLNAETLARTLDARVGSIRRISTADVAVQPPPVRPMVQRGMAMAEAGGGAETFETGQVSFSARVTAEFDLVVD